MQSNFNIFATIAGTVEAVAAPEVIGVSICEGRNNDMPTLAKSPRMLGQVDVLSEPVNASTNPPPQSSHFLFGNGAVDDFEFTPQTEDPRDPSASWLYAEQAPAEDILPDEVADWKVRWTSEFPVSRIERNPQKTNLRRMKSAPFDRGKIMRRAWDISRATQKGDRFDRKAFASALRLAWFEAKIARNRHKTASSTSAEITNFGHQIARAA